jgi:hypothetical protein
VLASGGPGATHEGGRSAQVRREFSWHLFGVVWVGMVSERDVTLSSKSHTFSSG